MTMTATIECFDPRAEGASRRVEIARDRIVISRRVGGVDMRVALEPRQFRGVALVVLVSEETDFLYAVRLVHADAELSVTLASCGEEEEACAHWRRWAEGFGLPLLVERRQGVYEIEAASAPFERRRGRATLNRRYRFLARRKMGRADLAALALNG